MENLLSTSTNKMDNLTYLVYVFIKNRNPRTKKKRCSALGQKTKEGNDNGDNDDDCDDDDDAVTNKTQNKPFVHCFWNLL